MRIYVVEVLRHECVRSDIFLFDSREEAEAAVHLAWKYEDVIHADWHQCVRNNIESFRETLNILTGEVL